MNKNYFKQNLITTCQVYAIIIIGGGMSLPIALAFTTKNYNYLLLLLLSPLLAGIFVSILYYLQDILDNIKKNGK